MSAHIPGHQVDGVLAAGFGAFLSKPFSRARLGEVLAGLLAGAGPQADGAPASGLAAEAMQVADWVDREFLRAEEEALGRAVLDSIVEVFRAQGRTLVAALIARVPVP